MPGRRHFEALRRSESNKEDSAMPRIKLCSEVNRRDVFVTLIMRHAANERRYRHQYKSTLQSEGDSGEKASCWYKQSASVDASPMN